MTLDGLLVLALAPVVRRARIALLKHRLEWLRRNRAVVLAQAEAARIEAADLQLKAVILQADLNYLQRRKP